MELRCRLDTVGDRPVLHALGEIDLATLPVLHDQLTRAISLHQRATLWVDLDGVTTLDDTGVGVLLGAFSGGFLQLQMHTSLYFLPRFLTFSAGLSGAAL